MKIEQIKCIRSRIPDLFLVVAIISSIVLIGCSPSGIRERNKSQQISAETSVKRSSPKEKDRNKNLDHNSDRSRVIDSNETFAVLKNSPEANLYSINRAVTILSWNIENFGQSKSNDIINFIANTIVDFDIAIIQEVVQGDGGAQAVAQLNDMLNRKGTKWDYIVSDPTSGESSYKRERYAFLWKPSKINLMGKPWLEIKYTAEINREPFLATFKFEGKEFTLVNFHAITKKMQPETEIKYFKFLPAEYSDKNLIFSGDFNCPQSHNVFSPLKKMGYKPIFEGQKTTLKKDFVNNEYLASEFDNIFYDAQRVNFINSGVIKFYESFDNLNDASTVSDHIPIWFQFSLK